MPPDPPPHLLAALQDSRSRWRDLALLGADLLFETDAAGRLSFLAPDEVLGHPAEALLGRPARGLLDTADGADPFDPAVPPRGLRAWLRDAAGSPACLEFTAMAHGGGLRGVGREVTAEEQAAAATALALRRATALGRLLAIAGGSRGPGTAAAALQALLEGIGPALGCGGAALLAGSAAGWQPVAGPLPPRLPPPGPLAEGADPLVVPAGPELALVAWGTPEGLRAEARGLLAALAPSVAALRAEAGRQAELDAAAHTDALTGLLNRRGFLAALAAARRRAPGGVLAFLDLDGLKPLNDRFGHAMGDAALVLVGRRLAAAAPGAPAGRLGGDEFALWLGGITPDAAAACLAPLAAPAPLPDLAGRSPVTAGASLGLAEAAAGESDEALLARADAAMYRAKRARRAA